jgi:integrase
LPTIRYNDKAVSAAKCRRDAKGNPIRTELRIVGGGCPVGFVLDLLPPTEAQLKEAKAKGVEPPEGAAVFRLVYSVPRPGGKRTLRKHRIGTRGVMPVHEARERALELRLRVERGEDPAAERKAEREAETFKELAERRLAAGDLGERTRELYEGCLEAAFKTFGSHAANKVSPQEIVKLIDSIAKRGALVQRVGEVGGARASELGGLDDEAAAVWTIPGKVMRKGKVVALNGRTTKAGREHSVPLSRQAVALFRRALDLAGDDAEFVFPAHAERRPAARPPAQGHLDRHSISRAMARLRGKFEIDQEGTSHDMRRTCATWLGEQGIRPDAIERILNHAPQGVTRKHYDHSRLEPMVREALQLWADHVDAMVRGKGRKRQPEATASDQASSVKRLGRFRGAASQASTTSRRQPIRLRDSLIGAGNSRFRLSL